MCALLQVWAVGGCFSFSELTEALESDESPLSNLG